LSTQAHAIENVPADEKAEIATIGDLEVELKERISRPAIREKGTLEQHIENANFADIETGEK
jgi:hypothetical protein